MSITKTLHTVIQRAAVLVILAPVAVVRWARKKHRAIKEAVRLKEEALTGRSRAADQKAKSCQSLERQLRSVSKSASSTDQAAYR